tara:strand:- start:54 stop:347 length:294 start_codon:yes stop_codon:yes gene_type:complete
MTLLEKINYKKFTIVAIFMFLYVMLNLLDGERGLISYFEKLKIRDYLIQEKKILEDKLFTIEKKNNLLTDVIDLDYLEMIYRKKFMVGKENEKIYIK